MRGYILTLGFKRKTSVSTGFSTEETKFLRPQYPHCRSKLTEIFGNDSEQIRCIQSNVYMVRTIAASICTKT